MPPVLYGSGIVDGEGTVDNDGIITKPNNNTPAPPETPFAMTFSNGDYVAFSNGDRLKFSNQ